VLTQQPLRVTGSIMDDAIKLFEVHRVSSPGDTWIGRWQFQTHFPTYPPYVRVVAGQVKFYELNQVTLPVLLGTGQQFGSGGPVVIRPLAVFLRDYQLGGGYTPGPLLLCSLLAGLAGSAFLLRRARRMTVADRDAARACCYLLASGLALLLLSDTFEFSWRYQLPALVTLPPAGALGITVIISYVRSLRGPRSAEGPAVATPGARDGIWPEAPARPAAPGPDGGLGPAAAPGGEDRAAPAEAPGGDDRPGLAAGPGAGQHEPQDTDHASAFDT
jgi:hypothetical protein